VDTNGFVVDGFWALVAAVLATGLVTWGTSPILGHFEGALIPWPTHGLAMAILIATPRHRQRAILAMLASVLVVATMLVAIRIGAPAVRGIPAVALLLAQSLVVAIVYERVSGGRSPLSGTTAYAWMLAVVVFGSIPLTAIASAVLYFAGNDAAPGYSGLAWWIAASTSGAALCGGVVTLLGGARGVHRGRSLLSLEFALLAAIYALAALSAFAEVGPVPGAVTPALAALPFLVWGGLRFGLRGYSVIAAVLVVVVIASNWVDIGPFARFDESQIETYRRAWIYLASLVGPAMIFPVALREREEAEERSRASLAQLQAIIEGTTDLIAAVDRNLVVIAANPAWVATYERMGGVPFRLGTSLADAPESTPIDRERSLALWRRALAGERFTVVREITSHDGERVEFEITYSPIEDARQVVVGASHVMRNITERRRREAEEAESRRLESVGRLAGGVAHDFNNLMTAVMGYSELIRSTLEPGDPRIADVAEVERAATRAGDLTQQLLAFARRRDVQPKDIDPGTMVRGIVGLIGPLIGPNITLEVRTSAESRLVRIDPTQFEQVVLNLTVNGRDAMPGGGRLVIETALETRGGVHGVQLTVSDTGEGMSADVLDRIFEPFFTTKPTGEGTGLGLATVHGIVHQAGGTIDVASSLGRGTTFDVFFPAAPAPAVTPSPS